MSKEKVKGQKAWAMMWPAQQRWDQPGAWDNPHPTLGLCVAAHEEFMNIIPGRICLKCKHRQFP